SRAQGAFQAAFAALGEPIAAAKKPPAGTGSQAAVVEAATPSGRAGETNGVSRPAVGRRFTDWSFGALPELMELTQRVGGREQTAIGYPALVDAGDAVELQLFDDPAQAAATHRVGLVRLFAIALREPLRFFEKNIPDFQRMSLLFATFGGADDLRRELVGALLERACLVEPLPSDAESFAARVADARTRLNLVGQELARLVAEILVEHAAAIRKLGAAKPPPAAAADLDAQLQALMPKRFVTATPPAQLRHVPRYLKAIGLRLDKLRNEPARDAQKLAELSPLLQGWRRLAAQRRGQPDARLDELRWLLEELRVSLFAQELRTPTPVSVKRLQKALDALRA
ncbi:MAG: DUF3418 domain-containing protein, partial [Burkholderiaceae bacterium]|nr:DUF3418 domain-containing protein [Burkholderiaceae bacterium]